MGWSWIVFEAENIFVIYVYEWVCAPMSYYWKPSRWACCFRLQNLLYEGKLIELAQFDDEFYIFRPDHE